jgi:hypothetical protein
LYDEGSADVRIPAFSLSTRQQAFSGPIRFVQSERSAPYALRSKDRRPGAKESVQNDVARRGHILHGVRDEPKRLYRREQILEAITPFIAARIATVTANQRSPKGGYV